MDIIVCYGFQVHIGKTGEAHEQEHVAHGTLAFVSRFYMDYPLQFLFGKERTPLVFGHTLELCERMNPYPAFFLRDIHQPLQGIDTPEDSGVCQSACTEHPVVVILDE